jgi:cytochrome b subunit of formate dehydrogenase
MIDHSQPKCDDGLRYGMDILLVLRVCAWLTGFSVAALDFAAVTHQLAVLTLALSMVFCFFGFVHDLQIMFARYEKRHPIDC